MWMLEGEWLAYTSRQDHVVHREYIPKGREKALVEWVQKTYSIAFMDGTSLRLRVKEVSKKELPVKNGYGNLIRDCFYKKVTSVAALYAKSATAGGGL